ncbi:MAG: DNA-binding response regulator [Clostridiales bacterium]|nr:DNA-binding response regulator [Clostridiales bacterium]
MGQALRKEEDKGSQDYLEILHNNSKGWITRSEINNGYNQWHYKYKDLIEQEFDKDNVYISLNTFYSTYRRIEYLKELKAQFIDLDIYKTKFTKKQILMNLEENYFNKSIPRPNLIVDSGRGLYLIWLINSVPSKALPLWKAVEEYLYSVLKAFGADRQALDPTRVLRVPGSINSKSNSVVKILDEYDYIYDLREIQNEFLPELDERVKKKRGRPKKTVFIHRERSLYYARIQDIIKICELRNYDLKGHRELILFLYRYYLCYFLEDPKKAFRSAEKVYLDKNKDYRYKNKTLIELLEISEEEERYMKTIISDKEYKRRDREYQRNKYQEKLRAEGKLTEKDKLSQRRAKIKDLLDEGLKQKDICLRLNISKATYIRDRNYLKEQGLI